MKNTQSCKECYNYSACVQYVQVCCINECVCLKFIEMKNEKGKNDLFLIFTKQPLYFNLSGHFSLVHRNLLYPLQTANFDMLPLV